MDINNIIYNRLNDHEAVSVSEMTELMRCTDSAFMRGAGLQSFLKFSGYGRGTVTLYESFQLMDTSCRLREGRISVLNNAVEYMNMALMARLFGDDRLHREYCRLAENAITAAGTGYYSCNISRILACDEDALCRLNIMRHTLDRNIQKDVCHWWFYPFDDIAYEDELLKLLKSGNERYDTDMTVSDDVCSLMAAAELGKE